MIQEMKDFIEEEKLELVKLTTQFYGEDDIRTGIWLAYQTIERLEKEREK